MARAPAGDQLGPLALRYATRTARIGRAAAPSAAEVILWSHSRVYFTTMRALVGKALAQGGARHWRDEANECAVQALTAIERSRRALEHWPEEDSERRELMGLLEALAEGLRAEFPAVARRAVLPVPGGRSKV